MENTNAYLPTVEDLALLHLAQPVERGKCRGLYFPVCRVCGRDHHHEALWEPETTNAERDDTVRVNECCDRCWLWFVSLEETITSADLDRQDMPRDVASVLTVEEGFAQATGLEHWPEL